MAAIEEMKGTPEYPSEWRAAVLEVEQARQHYARALAAGSRVEAEVDSSWMRLWRAERRRDKLLNSF